MTVTEETPLLGDATHNDVAPYTDVSYNSQGETTASDEGQPTGDVEGGDNPPVSIIAVMLPMLLGIFLVAMDQTIVISTYASIGSQFEQLENTSWIATGYMLSLTSFQPLYGKLSDIFGRKTCLLFAYIIFALGSLLCGLSRNMNELIISRVIAGIGGGGMSTVGSIIMSDIAPLRQRGTLQGIANIAYASGSATGAPLGGILADSLGWRWAFLIQVPLISLAILSVSIFLNLPKLPEVDLKAKFQRIDFLGAFTLVISVFSLLFALDRGGNVAWNDRFTIGSLVISCLSFSAFVATENWIAREPFAPRRIVASPALIASYLCNFFSNGAAFCIIYHVSLYLQAVRGLNAAQVGLALLPSICGGVTGSLGSGLIMQSTGRYYWLTVSMFGVAMAGAVAVAGVTGAWVHSFAGLMAGLAATSLGNGAGVTTTLIALIANAGPADQAIATAVSYLFRSLGSVVGLSVGTTLTQATLRKRLHERLSGADVDEIIKRVRESLDYLNELKPSVREKVVLSYQDGIQVALWFAAAVTVLTLFISIFIKEKHLTH